MPTEVLLTIEDLVDRYQIGRPQIWRWRKAGKLPPPIPVGLGDRPRWRLADLIAFENRQPERV